MTEHICIVGGGMAGLYCAYQLLKSGRPVLLFEKDKNLGGRMLTEIVQEKDKTYYLEGGAGVIRNDETDIIQLLKDLRVEMNFWKSGTALVYNDGEKSKILDLNLEKVLRKVCSNSSNDKSFLRTIEIAPVTEEEKTALVIGTTYSELLEANSEHVCQENDWYEFTVPSSEEIKFGKPSKGWQDFIDKITEKILEMGGKIFVNSPVKEIGNGYLKVKGVQEKIPYSDIIITTPIHFLENVKLNYALNTWVEVAKLYIRETNYLRIYSYFEKPLEITMKICTNLSIRRVIPINQNIIMTVYTDGMDATQINALSKDQNKLNRYIESQLGLLLGRKIPKIKKSWVFYWPKGISSWKPSDKPVEQILPILQHPYPNIHFCGDSYSMHPGWLEGAVESSDQVIEHIIKS